MPDGFARMRAICRDKALTTRACRKKILTQAPHSRSIAITSSSVMTAHPDGDVRYSLVIPVFNEEAVLPILLRRIDGLLNEQLDAPAEAIFVDDGSSDCTSIILEAKAKDDPRYRYIRLTRNFGHQVAITAGLDAAAGAAVIVMDADLQDPPEVVIQMIGQWKDGSDVV